MESFRNALSRPTSDQPRPIHNPKMLEEQPELVVAFPGGNDTADMVRKAKQAGVEVFVVEGE